MELTAILDWWRKRPKKYGRCKESVFGSFDKKETGKDDSKAKREKGEKKSSSSEKQQEKVSILLFHFVYPSFLYLDM